MSSIDLTKLAKVWNVDEAFAHMTKTRLKLEQDQIETLVWLGLAIARIRELEGQRKEDFEKIWKACFDAVPDPTESNEEEK